MKKYHPKIRSNQLIDSENMKNVFTMIDQHKESIAVLLSKYQDQQHPNRSEVKDTDFRLRRQTIDANLPNNKNAMAQNKKSRRTSIVNLAEMSRRQSVSLPSVQVVKKKMTKSIEKNVKIKPSEQASYFKQKQKMKEELEKAYRNPYDVIKWEERSRMRQRQKKAGKKLNPIVSISQIEEKPIFEADEPDEGQPESGFIESDDSSSQQQVPTKQYEKQFRELMKSQCVEEINYLYFCRNEKLKEWTENLLCLIQKHDKEIYSTRIKCKYLHSFDDKFFSIGIYDTDQA